MPAKSSPPDVTEEEVSSSASDPELGDMVLYQYGIEGECCPGIVRKVREEEGRLDLALFLGPEDWPTAYGAVIRVDSALGAYAENRPRGEELGHWKPR